MNWSAAIVAAAALLHAGGSTPSAQTSLQGVWRVVAVTTTGTGATVDNSPEPGLFIFTARHYSFTRVTGDGPRTMVAENDATANQLRDILRFSAQAGTYTVTGSDLVLRRVAALATSNMTPGNDATYSFRLAGDSLWLTSKAYANRRLPYPLTIKLTRVE
jgi:hypothetical protein